MLGNLFSMGVGTFGLVLTPVAFLGVAFTVTVLDLVLAMIGGRRHLESNGISYYRLC